MKKILIIITCVLFTLFNLYLYAEIRSVKANIGKYTDNSEISSISGKITDLEATIKELQDKNEKLNKKIMEMQNIYDGRMATMSYIINNNNKEIIKINKWQEKFTNIFQNYRGTVNFSNYVWDLDKYYLELKGE
jgi:predicted RNase H-like nuclease (RuvC/YqgF family)